jgi:hypothetical protein
VAFLPIELDEEEEEKPVQPMGAGVGMGAPAAPSSAPAQAAPTSNPGQFINFERYIAANKDGAKKTADGLAGDVEKAGSDVQKGLGAAQTKFGAGVEAGNPFPVTATAQSAMSARPTAAPRQVVTTPAPSTSLRTLGSDYGVPAIDSSKAPQQGSITADQARAEGKKSYTGPSSLDQDSGWGDLLSKAQTGASKANLLGSEEGIQTSLKNKVHGPYTQGQSMLDTALAQNAGGRRFGELKSKYGGLSKMLEGANVTSTGQADAARIRTGEIAGNYGKAADDYETEKAAKQKAILAELKFPGSTVKQDFVADINTWAPKDEAHAKKQTFKDYTTLRPEDYVRGVGKMLSPADLLADALGLPAPIDVRTNMYENGTGLNSNRSKELTSKDGDVYQSMTQAELDALEKMPVKAQKEWVEARRKQLRGG